MNIKHKTAKDVTQDTRQCALGHDDKDINIPIPENSPSTTIYKIQQMDCPMEEALIRKKLHGMEGVNGLEFNLIQRTLKVGHTPESLTDITEALMSLDLGAEVLDSEYSASSLETEPPVQWKRLLVAGLLALASEIVHFVSGPAFLVLALAILAICLGGLTTYKKGWIALKNLNLNMNALMSFAVTGAVIIGQWPEAAMVMVLFTLAEVIEAKSLNRARKAIQKLLSLTPEKTTVLMPNGLWSEIDIKDVDVGNRVRVRPGERIALDGTIVLGQSTINQSPITGESLPVEKKLGDAVFAGTINESGSFEYLVTATSANSTLSHIIYAVEAAQSTKAPIQRFVDHFAKYYTPSVFIIAILVAIIPPLLFGLNWFEWTYTALVLLVIACPCALVISTPVSIVSGLAAATRHGILIKGGTFLEQGRKLTCLALDKTGTLTHGTPTQTDFIQLGSMDKEAILQIAASLTSRSDHPVSKAITENAYLNKIQIHEVSNFTAVPGQGIKGSINGKEWNLGNRKMLDQQKHSSKNIAEKISKLETKGKSVVVLFGEQEVEAIFAVADTVKNSSSVAISELKKLGIKTIMLTGDNQHTARTIADEVGIDEVRAELLPGDKLDVIKTLLKKEKVGMVGDGINDAPALAIADIGFAMGAAGTDTAIETADVALMDDDLNKIPRFIKLSKSTYNILIQNITVALGIKAIFFGLTFIGAATMWMAVFADVGTSLMVVANGLRLLRK